jgi:hypothetical protein
MTDHRLLEEMSPVPGDISETRLAPASTIEKEEQGLGVEVALLAQKPGDIRSLKAEWQQM